jgi:hypothetical protein
MEWRNVEKGGGWLIPVDRTIFSTSLQQRSRCWFVFVTSCWSVMCDDGFCARARALRVSALIARWWPKSQSLRQCSVWCNSSRSKSMAQVRRRKKNKISCDAVRQLWAVKGDETVSLRPLECVEEIEDIIESQVKSIDGNWIQDQEGCWGRLRGMYRYALVFFLYRLFSSIDVRWMRVSERRLLADEFWLKVVGGDNTQGSRHVTQFYRDPSHLFRG